MRTDVAYSVKGAINIKDTNTCLPRNGTTILRSPGGISDTFPTTTRAIFLAYLAEKGQKFETSTAFLMSRLRRCCRLRLCVSINLPLVSGSRWLPLNPIEGCPERFGQRCDGVNPLEASGKPLRGRSSQNVESLSKI